jgi:hypothetical protein
MYVKDYQQKMNIFYNSNVYRNTIYNKLSVNNSFLFNGTNRILNILKKHFNYLPINKYINPIILNNLFPILDYRKVDKFFTKKNVSKKIPEDFDKIFNLYNENLQCKKNDMKIYLNNNENKYYLKFIVHEDIVNKVDNLEKSHYEYFYNTVLLNLNTQNVIDNEIDEFLKNIVYKSKRMKICVNTNDEIINDIILSFSCYYPDKKNNYYYSKLMNDKSIIEKIKNNLNKKNLIINRICIIKPQGYLNLDCINTLYTKQSFDFNKKFIDYYINKEITKDAGLIFFKNYDNAITLSYLVSYCKKLNCKENEKEYIYTTKLIDEAIFLVLFTLYKIMKYFPKFKHNDLHLNNILVYPCNKNKIYIINNKIYCINTINIKIIDFEMSTLGEDYLINNYIKSLFDNNDFGLDNNINSYYDIHYFLNIIYSNMKNTKYQEIISKYIDKSFFGQENSYIKNWRLRNNQHFKMNTIGLFEDDLFKQFIILKIKK